MLTRKAKEEIRVLAQEERTRRLIAEAFQVIFEEKKCKSWFSEKAITTINRTIENVAVHAVALVLESKLRKLDSQIKDTINREEFIDKLIERINRKQLSK